MSDPRFTNPYATPTQAGIGPDVAVAPRPDARTQAAFLTQAFVWMFLGLAVTAGVSFVVQSNTRLLQFAGDNVLVLIIGQLVLAFAIQLGIRRMSATLALGLFFVYAASLGLTIGLIVSFYTTGSVVTAFLSASATVTSPSGRWRVSAACCSWASSVCWSRASSTSSWRATPSPG
jgi:FtsH-binding integral membrane protein